MGRVAKNKLKRRIGMVCYFDPDTYPGVFNSCNMLAENGWQVDLVCLDQYGFGGAAFDNRVRIHRLRHAQSGPLSNLQSYLTLARTVRRVGRRMKWDYLVGHDMFGFVAARLAGAAAPANVVFWSQDLAEPSQLPLAKKPLYALQKHFIKSCPLAIAASNARAECMSRSLPMTGTPVVVYNSPRLAAWDTGNLEWRRRLGISEEKVVGIYAGGIGRNRYIPELVRSVALWPPEFHLIIAGYGRKDVIEEIQQIAVDSGFESRLHILEHLPSVTDLIAEADFGISLFEHDPAHRNLRYRGLASNKIFEYFACGCPAVVSDNEETRKLLETFKCGTLVTKALPENIAGCVRAIAEDPRRLADMSEQAKFVHREETHFERRWSVVQQIFEKGNLEWRPGTMPPPPYLAPNLKKIA